MKRWAVLLVLSLSGCIGMDEYYLGPYHVEPPPNSAGCGCPPAPLARQTAPPPLVQTSGSSLPQTAPPPIAQTSGNLPVIRSTAEPALATTTSTGAANWLPRPQ